MLDLINWIGADFVGTFLIYSIIILSLKLKG
jgi:hypothetical protein